MIKELKERSTAYNKLKNVPNTEAGAIQASLDWLDYFEYSTPYVTDANQRNIRIANAKGAYNIVKNFT